MAALISEGIRRLRSEESFWSSDYELHKSTMRIANNLLDEAEEEMENHRTTTAKERRLRDLHDEVSSGLLQLRKHWYDCEQLDERISETTQQAIRELAKIILLERKQLKERNKKRVPVSSRELPSDDRRSLSSQTPVLSNFIESTNLNEDVLVDLVCKSYSILLDEMHGDEEKQKDVCQQLSVVLEADR